MGLTSFVSKLTARMSNGTGRTRERVAAANAGSADGAPDRVYVRLAGQRRFHPCSVSIEEVDGARCIVVRKPGGKLRYTAPLDGAASLAQSSRLKLIVQPATGTELEFRCSSQPALAAWRDRIAIRPTGDDVDEAGGTLHGPVHPPPLGVQAPSAALETRRRDADRTERLDIASSSEPKREKHAVPGSGAGVRSAGEHAPPARDAPGAPGSGGREGHARSVQHSSLMSVERPSAGSASSSRLSAGEEADVPAAHGPAPSTADHRSPRLSHSRDAAGPCGECTGVPAVRVEGSVKSGVKSLASGDGVEELTVGVRCAREAVLLTAAASLGRPSTSADVGLAPAEDATSVHVLAIDERGSAVASPLRLESVVASVDAAMAGAMEADTGRGGACGLSVATSRVGDGGSLVSGDEAGADSPTQGESGAAAAAREWLSEENGSPRAAACGEGEPGGGALVFLSQGAEAVGGRAQTAGADCSEEADAKPAAEECWTAVEEESGPAAEAERAAAAQAERVAAAEAERVAAAEAERAAATAAEAALGALIADAERVAAAESARLIAAGEAAAARLAAAALEAEGYRAAAAARQATAAREAQVAQMAAIDAAASAAPTVESAWGGSDRPGELSPRASGSSASSASSLPPCEEAGWTRDALAQAAAAWQADGRSVASIGLVPPGARLLLSPSLLGQLCEALPPAARLRCWSLAFSTDLDGCSLLTFFCRLDGHPQSVLLVRDSAGALFGAYLSEAWRSGPRYFGTGESFLFSARRPAELESRLVPFRWTRANAHFAHADAHGITFGSSDCGLALDASLEAGSSRVSRTYGNPPLAGALDFVCVKLEVWSLGR